MMLNIIKYGELLLGILPRIFNGLRTYIKQLKECFIPFPNTSKLVKKNLAASHFSNPLLSICKSDETPLFFSCLIYNMKDI